MNPELLLAHFNRICDAPDATPRLRRFILELAVRGKLVQQDPSDEPAPELLKRIGTMGERRKGRMGLKRKEALPLADSAQGPFELPAGWTWARFPELGFFGRGKSKHRPAK
jgi:type I restriction enzyme S subunit